MSTETKEPYDVNVHLEQANIKRITTIEEIEEVYDYELLKTSNDLVCEKTDKITIILFDTPTPECAFLAEKFNDYIEECGELLEHFEVLYCDTKSVYEALFKKYFSVNEIDYRGECEIPVVLVVNGIDNEIVIEMETFIPIDVQLFEKLINELN